jgi:hypothetical protein
VGPLARAVRHRDHLAVVNLHAGDTARIRVVGVPDDGLDLRQIRGLLLVTRRTGLPHLVLEGIETFLSILRDITAVTADAIL